MTTPLVRADDFEQWMSKTQRNSQGANPDDCLSDLEVGELLLKSLEIDDVELEEGDSISDIASKVHGRVTGLFESDRKLDGAPKRESQPQPNGVKLSLAEQTFKVISEAEGRITIDEVVDRVQGLPGNEEKRVKGPVKAAIGRMNTKGRIRVHPDDSVSVEE